MNSHFDDKIFQFLEMDEPLEPVDLSTDDFLNSILKATDDDKQQEEQVKISSYLNLLKNIIKINQQLFVYPKLQYELALSLKSKYVAELRQAFATEDPDILVKFETAAEKEGPLYSLTLAAEFQAIEDEINEEIIRKNQLFKLQNTTKQSTEKKSKFTTQFISHQLEQEKIKFYLDHLDNIVQLDQQLAAGPELKNFRQFTLKRTCHVVALKQAFSKKEAALLPKLEAKANELGTKYTETLHKEWETSNKQKQRAKEIYLKYHQKKANRVLHGNPKPHKYASRVAHAKRRERGESGRFKKKETSIMNTDTNPTSILNLKV